MGKILIGLLMGVALCGCSSSLTSPLLDMAGSVSVPILNGPRKMPVVFPAAADSEENYMAEAYGPAWKNLEADYPEYEFNK